MNNHLIGDPAVQHDLLKNLQKVPPRFLTRERLRGRGRGTDRRSSDNTKATEMRRALEVRVGPPRDVRVVQPEHVDGPEAGEVGDGAGGPHGDDGVGVARPGQMAPQLPVALVVGQEVAQGGW